MAISIRYCNTIITLAIVYFEYQEISNGVQVQKRQYREKRRDNKVTVKRIKKEERSGPERCECSWHTP